MVKDANGNDVSSQFAVTLVPGKLEIAKRSVTLTSASESRVYNGEALTNDDVTVGGDGFVAGEGAVYNVTGTITDAGKVANSFTYERNSNTNFDNYNISKEEGALKVTPVTDKVTVTITENADTVIYDTKEHSVKGYKSMTADNTLYDVTTSVRATETAAWTAKGTYVGTYHVGIKAGDFKNTSGNFTNVEFVIVDGARKIAPALEALGRADAARDLRERADIIYEGT